MRRVLSLVVVSVVVVFCGGAGAGSYFPPPGDYRPVWSPDSSAIAFASHRSWSMRVVGADGRGERALPLPPHAEFAPSWRHVAYRKWPDRTLVVVTPEGHGERAVADGVMGDELAWSPDETRIAFSRDDGAFVVAADGSGLTRVFDRGGPPSWSPDGVWIAWLVAATGDRDLLLVHPDGSGARLLDEHADSPIGHPEWSPDATRMAYVTGRFEKTAVRIVYLDGRPAQTFRAPYAAELEWRPDGRAIAYAGRGIHVRELGTRRTTRLTWFGSSLAWEPNGHALAFSGGGECKDRIGIFWVSASGGTPERRSNDCRIVGTDGNDRLTGTSELAEVLYGGLGDDTLTTLDTGYMSDDVVAGPGDDRITGGSRPNYLAGNPGNDILEGLAGWDTLDGGSGRDVMDGGGARDVILANDGERDTVRCGTSNGADAGAENDYVYADSRDVVARDCEIVHRAPAAGGSRTVLRVTVWRGTRAATRTVRCPSPRDRRRCAALARNVHVLRPPPPATYCVRIFVGQPRAIVSGVFRGRPVWTSFTGAGDCSYVRWAEAAFLADGLR